MSLIALLFLALGGLSVIIGIFFLSGFVHYRVKKNIKQPPVKTSTAIIVPLPQPEMYNYYPDNTGYYYRENSQYTTVNPQIPLPGKPADKNSNIKDMRKAQPLRIEVVNYYGPEDDNNRYYYGN